jgi:hypothetical protein
MSAGKAVQITVIILFSLSISLLHPAYAQQSRLKQEKELLLPGKKLRLDSLGALVARQTGYIFSFNAQKINPGLTILLTNQSITVRSLLEQLKSRYKLRHRIAGNYIIIHNEPLVAKELPPATKPIANVPKAVRPKTVTPPKREQKAAIVSPPRNNNNNKPLASPTPSRANTAPVISDNQQQQPVVDTTTTGGIKRQQPSRQWAILPAAVNNYDGPGINPGSIAPRADTSLPSLKQTTGNSPASNSRAGGNAGGGGGRGGRDRTRSGNSNFFAAAGLAADDVFYASPTLHTGFPWLYLIAKWNTNFDVQGISYGVGTSLRLGDNDWKMGLDVTMGNLSKSYHPFPPPSDTMTIQVKGRLLRINLQLEKELGSHWQLRFGPVFNMLRSSYYINGKSIAIDTYFPPGADIDGTYYVIKPVYTISNNYKTGATTSNKSWIGLQVSLLYRIPSFNKN